MKSDVFLPSDLQGKHSVLSLSLDYGTIQAYASSQPNSSTVWQPFLITLLALLWETISPPDQVDKDYVSSKEEREDSRGNHK